MKKALLFLCVVAMMAAMMTTGCGPDRDMEAIREYASTGDFDSLLKNYDPAVKKGLTRYILMKETPELLSTALYCGNTKAADELWKIKYINNRGINFLIQNSGMANLGHQAAAGGHKETVAWLRSHNFAGWQQKGDQGYTPAAVALRHCNLEFYKEIGVYSDEVFAVNQQKRTFLHNVAKEAIYHQVECFATVDWYFTQLLGENSLIINKQDVDGNTALHYAVASRSTESVKLLLKYGADVSVKNGQAETAMNVAVARALPDIIALLREATPTVVAPQATGEK
jgi:ankyrin repeat protein